MRDLSSMMGLQVIAVDEGRRLGVISHALVDLAAGELVAVMLSGLPGKSLIMAKDFKVVGQDALMVEGVGVLRSRAEVEEDLARSRDVLTDPPVVITDRGTKLGQLANVYLADDGRTVIRYGISGGPLRDVTTGAIALPVLKGTVHGNDTIIVPHDAAHRYLAEAAGGLKGSLEKLARIFRLKYDQISERSSELYHGSEERLRAQTSKARERAGELVDEARQKVREVTERELKPDTDDEEPDIQAAKDQLRAARGAAPDDDQAPGEEETGN